MSVAFQSDAFQNNAFQTITDVIVYVLGVQAIGYVGSVSIWGLIDDSQTPNWYNIVNAQTPSWNLIPNPQTPSWIEIDASDPSLWS